MRRMFRGLSFGILTALLGAEAHADIVKARVTSAIGIRSYDNILARLNAGAGTTFTMADFALAENFAFGSMRVQTWMQMREGKPVQGTAMRVWLTPQGGFIVAEGHFEKPSNKHNVPLIMATVRRYLDPSYLDASAPLLAQRSRVAAAIEHHHDPVASGFTHKDVWADYDFQRVFTGVGKRGTHEVRFSHRHQRVVARDYRVFERAGVEGELEPIAAKGYRLFERHWYRPAGVLPSEDLTLKYIKTQTVAMAEDPFGALTANPWAFADNLEARQQMNLDPAAATWSFAQLQAQLEAAARATVKSANGFDSPQGLVLDGRYVNVTVHNEARGKVAEPGFPWLFSEELAVRQAPTPRGPAIVLATNLRAAPFRAAAELLENPVRVEDNKFETLIPRPADQIQVYWAVTEMMDQLRALGFTDPEISTRKFTAILYNPDPFFADNAFYVSDTINFTSYTAGSSNFARDNTVIWHELGHGIVDRMGGPFLTLAKYRGFGEGMADFLAELVLQASSFQRDFPGRTSQRIYNRTPFNLSGQEHDDGEAFGGVMKDLLDLAITRWGRAGLEKTADLTLEAIRFVRNHPGLNEQEWIEKLRFVDQRPSPKRAAGGFADLITQALAGRNFAVDPTRQASAVLLIDGSEPRRGEATSDNPLPTTLGTPRSLQLGLKLTDGESYRFNYPVRVVLRSNRGPTGPVDWINEDAGPQIVTLNGPEDEVKFETGTTGQCDELNQGLGCREGLTIDVFPAGAGLRPLLRKRIFVQVMPAASVLLLGGSSPESAPGPTGPQVPSIR